MKSVLVLAVLLVAKSLAQENLQQAAAPGGDLSVQDKIIGSFLGRPWGAWVAEERVARQMAETQREVPSSTSPESSNYESPRGRGWCVSIGFVSYCHSKRDFIPSVQAAAEEEEVDAQFQLLGSEAEVKPYGSRDNVRAFYKTPVSRAELYERPLDPRTPATVAQALDYKQSAVVVTLDDGRRFMLVKGNNRGEGRQTVIIHRDHISDDWVKVAAKDITRSVLQDFLKAGGLSFDALRDNGKDAATRMMALE